MSQKDCIAKFLGKINHNELMDTAAEFEKRGQSANDAMLSAVQDKIDELEIEQTKVMKAVREAWVKDGGKEAPKKIEDIGEKIGGARKDTAVSTGTKRKTSEPEDSRPTWAKRFQISQIAGGFDASVNGRDVTGKWAISDLRNKDRFDQPKQVGKYFDSKEDAEAALPLLAVAQKHRVLSGDRAEDGSYRQEIWRDINDRKRVKVVEQDFATRDEAMRYMAQHAKEILETNTTFGESDIPKPESTVRQGVKRRTGDVEGEDFKDAFGMRGVEFGNWNNQAERQEVMNAAYDGLMDLADVLGVPPKAIGLNGDLALAFGARGHGLSGARAHYETDRVVMNLTKMNGAGALAHEWFHALDHYLARQDGKSSSEWKVHKDGTRSLAVHGGDSDMASGGFRRMNSGVREELRDAYTKLVRSLFTKAEQYVEDTARADKFVGVARAELEKELGSMRANLSEQMDTRYYKRYNKPATAEQLAEFDAIAAELVEGRGLATEWKTLPGHSQKSILSRHTNDALEKLGEINKLVRGRSGFSADKRGTLDSLTGYMRRYEQRLNMLADANKLTAKTKQVPTSFAMDAKSLDQGRGGDYWTSPHEMVARAFQGYVEDKIAAKDGKSPFLNYAPENAGIITPWGAKRPFPAGEERQAMNGEFDKFIGAIKTKETDKGVAMYSRSPFGTPTTVTALQSAIKELTGVEGKNQLGKVVATTASEIKSTWEPLIGQSVNIESEGDAGAAQAFYDPKSKTVFLIADNIREGTETAVLAHELMHKHGQTVLGKEGWDRLHGVINTWANADQESNEYAVYNYARNKVEAVGLELSNQELFPYAVEAALKMGIKPDMAAGRGTVARWLESVRQSLKMVWDKITGKPETFKAQDMVNLAFGIAQMENPENSAYIKDFDNADKSTTINSGTDQNERTAGNSESPGIGRQDAEQDMATSLGGEPAPRGWSSATRISREGRPITVYRGAAEPLHVNHFGKDSLGKASGNPSSGLGVWFTTGKGEAQTYGKASSHNLDIRNPKLIRADELPGFDSVDDAHAYRETLRKQGYDGILISARHLGKQELHIVAFEPDQVIDPKGSIQFSRSSIVGQTNRQYSADQLRAFQNVGFQTEAPSLKERAQALWKDAGKKLAQGIVDQFAPVKDLDKNAYGLLRLAKGASGAFEAFLQGGKLKLTDGVYDFDDTQKGGVIDKLLIPLQGEHHDFMRWVAANRAERLASEGKENLFSAQDIADLKTLANGTTDFDYTIQTGPGAGRVTRDRTLIYADANRVFSEFNKNVLDMAEQSGLIDGASRKVWEHEFYVPFYRVADEDGGGVRGMSVKGSVLRQQAFKELKGGKNALNADLLDNTLMNWAHLLDASAKNRAAKATIEAAERLGIAAGGNQSTLASMGASVHNKNGVVWFMDGGQKRYSLIDNTGDGPFLMTAINALEYAGMRNPVMNAMGAMKHALTVGVTASPFFKVRNLIRDSVQAIGTGNLSYNPAANIAQGWKLTDPKSDAYFRLLAGGGTIHFGTMMEGSESKRVQALVESGVDDATILNDEHKVKAFYRKFIEPGVTAYNELGNRGEAINRAALYDQLRKQGMNHADASLQARDLMDFSMQGSFTSIRFLTQVVPFFNARIQGLYKLGRAAKEDPARFGAVLGAAAIMSIGLLAAYGDDDDWKKREEWDRNNFWWFKFAGTAFRIPKPFEIGAIATLAERGFELAFDKEMTNKRFMNQVVTLLGDNLSMNPVPQLVKPMLDVYANKDSFSGRPIETMGMDKLKSEYRFTDRTSMAARGLSTAANSVTGLVGAEALSPVQIDSMLRGYFGWLGSFVIGAADVIARPATGQTEHASSDMLKVATGSMVSDLRDAPSRYVSQMYTQAKEIEQAYGTWRSLLKEGKTAEAGEFYKDNQADLSKYRNVESVKRAEAKFNERIRLIERSNMDGDAKRELIRSIQQQKNRVAQLVS